MEVNEDSTWPSVTELVNYALAPEDPAHKQFYARLRRAHTTDPDKGREIFLKLLRNPLSRVREFAVLAGSKFGGPELIGLLPELLDDPNLSVQETAMQALGKLLLISFAPERTCCGASSRSGEVTTRTTP